MTLLELLPVMNGTQKPANAVSSFKEDILFYISF